MNVDLHAHVLPAADHGCDGLETALQQLSLAKSAGIDVLCATPHFYPRRESAEAFLERRGHAVARLRKALPHGAPRLLVGAETHLCRGLHNMPQLEQLCFEGTNVLLLELCRDFSISSYEHTLEGLLYERKLTVVLAHIDRYNPVVIDFLLSMGCYAQLNAEAFCHLRTRSRAMSWTESQQVVALGSDIHGTDIGYRDFLRAKARLGARYSTVMERTKKILGL